MSKDFTFDQRASQRVERLYQTPDIVEQRRASRALLALKPGEYVLDIGCGPGLLVMEMAQEVGAQGSVAGIDVSADMLALARVRCTGRANVGVQDASATALPYAENAFDAVAVAQVYEFVDDLALALAELKRVLKPRGRALIVDTDWDSVIWRNTRRSCSRPACSPCWCRRRGGRCACRRRSANASAGLTGDTAPPNRPRPPAQPRRLRA